MPWSSPELTPCVVLESYKNCRLYSDVLLQALCHEPDGRTPQAPPTSAQWRQDFAALPFSKVGMPFLSHVLSVAVIRLPWIVYLFFPTQERRPCLRHTLQFSGKRAPGRIVAKQGDISSTLQPLSKEHSGLPLILCEFSRPLLSSNISNISAYVSEHTNFTQQCTMAYHNRPVPGLCGRSRRRDDGMYRTCHQAVRVPRVRTLKAAIAPRNPHHIS